MLGGIKRNAQAFKAYAYETDETGQTVPAATCRAGKASRTAALMDLRLPSLPKLGRSKEGNHSDLEMMAASERYLNADKARKVFLHLRLLRPTTTTTTSTWTVWSTLRYSAVADISCSPMRAT